MLFSPRIKLAYYLSLLYNTEFTKTAPIVGELRHADKTHSQDKWRHQVSKLCHNENKEPVHHTYQLIQEERDQLQEAARRDDKPG